MLFPACENVARKAVNDIVRAQLAAETASLDIVKKIRALIGPVAFAEAVDGVPAAKLKPLLGRIDPHLAIPSAAPERIKHLLALADGSVALSAPASGKKSATKKAPAAEQAAAPGGQRRKVTGRAALRVADKR